MISEGKKSKTVYICDPEKFKVCSGRYKHRWCGVRCFCTSNKQFAKDPEHPLTYEEYLKERDRRNKKETRDGRRESDEKETRDE